MPEGPLLVLYKEDLSALTGHLLEAAESSLRSADLQPLEGRKLTGITTWGKYLFMQFGDALHLRIHWGMFGVYYLDRDRPGKLPKAVLYFSGDRVLRLYSVSLRVLQGVPSSADYDPRADVMNPAWDDEIALQKLCALPPSTLVCDALLDQKIFAGVGNAIKTEALYARSIHPESVVHALPPEVLAGLVDETLGQSMLFLEGKRTSGVDRYGWTLAYRRKHCPRCDGPISNRPTGVLQRKSHWCEACAVRYR